MSLMLLGKARMRQIHNLSYKSGLYSDAFHISHLTKRKYILTNTLFLAWKKRRAGHDWNDFNYNFAMSGLIYS